MCLDNVTLSQEYSSVGNVLQQHSLAVSLVGSHNKEDGAA